MQFRVIVVTDPQTHTPTDRTDYNTLRRSFASAQCTLHTYVTAYNEKMLEYYGVGCFVTQTGNTCTYCWYITLLESDKQTNIHITQRINLNNAIDPRNLPSLLLFVVSSLFSRDYFWLCQVSHSFSKEESSKIADERFLQARCLFCHPINSVKAKQ